MHLTKEISKAMIIEQLSIFLNNSVGRLSEVTGLLGENGINLKALSLSESDDFGILRLITDDNRKAFEVLDAGGFAVSTTKVVCMELGDNPGALSEMVQKLAKGSVSVENLYAYSVGNKATIVIKVADVELCERILSE